MRLVHLELRLDFAEEIREYSLAQKVHRAITGKIPKETEQQIRKDVVIQSPKRKVAVRWDSESFGAVLEELPDIGSFVGTVMPILERINKVAPIGKLRNRTLVTNWLLPTPNYNFSALEHKYRETMIVHKTVCEGTFDSSVMFDSNISDGVLHHQSGPMGIKQLLDDFLNFKPDDVPKVFLFMLASITERKVIQYSSEDMYSFLVKSFDLCKSHSDTFEQIWEEIL